MSSNTLESGDRRPRDDAPTEDEAVDDLTAQVELLAEENRRLREEYVRARRSDHRRTALGLFAVGAVAVLAAIALPGSRDILLSLSGIGLFGGVLTYYLTPEQFVAGGTGERVYAAHAETGTELVGELGLKDERVYAPAEVSGDEFGGVRLFVPQRTEYSVPDPDALDTLYVVSGAERERGVSLPPTGGGLFRQFEASMTSSVARRPDDLAVQLSDALVEGFELLESATPSVDTDEGRVAFEVRGCVHGPIHRFDHPVVSFLAVGLAARLDTPVRVEIGTDVEGTAADLIACEWDPDEVDAAGLTEPMPAEESNENA